MGHAVCFATMFMHSLSGLGCEVKLYKTVNMKDESSFPPPLHFEIYSKKETIFIPLAIAHGVKLNWKQMVFGYN